MTETPETLAGSIAERVFRDDLALPGFAALDLGPDLTPEAFETFLERLAGALAGLYRQRYGVSLTVQPQGRFDQQRSTLPHRDGGPDRSVLVLGYEPTPIDSRLFLLDFTRCACQQGL